MGLEKVIEQIEHDGEEKIRSLLRDAEHQADQLLQTTRKEIEAKSKLKKLEIVKQITMLQAQERSAVEIEAKKIQLNAKKVILANTYQQCLASLQTLPHQKILSALFKNLEKELPEAAVVYSNERDEKVVRSLTKLQYGGVIDCLGGIIAENDDKTITVDYRYETIAAAIWDNSLKEIAEHLFG
ncbi:MAG TPA: V-type ATP synthase subunit E family protein [Candidatus Thermoplasmatota archaeon]|nr:V-type ATP synthase subunit E family protein [Candidatus Thermoplasmatota archaeon]